jgi:chromosome segregation ATPase
MVKELMDQAKKAAEESKEEYKHVIENIMITMNEAKDEVVAKGEEIADLQMQLQKAKAEKNRADNKIEMLTADKEEAEANVNQFQEQINATIWDYEMKINNITMKYLGTR